MTDMQTSLPLLIVRPSILNLVINFSTHLWPVKWDTLGYTFALRIPFHLLQCWCNTCTNTINNDMIHFISSCDQGGEDRDMTWLDGPVASVNGKLSDDLAPMDRSNGEEQVRSRSMNQYSHVMIWSESYHCWLCWCMCCINIGGDRMECARQRYNLGHFISPVIGV